MNFLVDMLDYLFIDVPEIFFDLLVAAAFFNLTVNGKMWSMTIASLVLGVITKCFELYSPFVEYKLPVFLLLITLTMMYIYRTGVIVSLFACILTFTAYLCFELSVIMLMQLFMIDIHDISSDITYMCVAMYSIFGCQWLLAWILRTHKVDLRRYLPKSKMNVYLIALILLILLEFLLIFTLNIRYYLVTKFNLAILTYNNVPVFHTAILIVFTGIIFCFYKYLTLKVKRTEHETENAYIQNYNDLVVALKTVKHDAANHYMVIQQLLKNRSYHDAYTYISDMVSDVQDIVSKIQGIKNPAISALLQSKRETCKTYHIDMDIVIKSKSQGSHIKTNDMITLLGNLLDNAVRANTEIERGRKIELVWVGNEKEDKIQITNSSRTILPDEIGDLFRFGYSTKESGGGTGLAAVKKVVTKYDGKINVIPKENAITFEVVFPISKIAS